jgi:DNA topoisomerase-3
MKSLVIAEKPSVARDIARVLGCNKKEKTYLEGKNYVVTWGLGHLVTLADPEDYNKKYKEWNMEDLPMMPQHLKLVVIRQTSHQFNGVKACIHRKDIGQIIIATDAGREGELVARWILEKAGNQKPVKRLWISSVTDKAIRQGFEHLRDGKEYENLYRAAVARAEADWLVGINATRALTCKYNAQLSCGRVQTPTLAMIAQREEEIRRFVPKPYYGLTARAEGILFTWREARTQSTSVMDKEKRESALEHTKNQPGIIQSVQQKKKKSYSDALYDLTELQRDANERFGYSAKQTLNIMQRLYEHHKVLTYPRTDSRYLTDDIVETIPERLSAISVGPYKPYTAALLKKKIKANGLFVNNQKVSDHHAIIPTEQTPVLSSFSIEERKIYDLVVRRFLAVLYPPCEYEQTTYEMEVGGERFTAQGNVILEEGYREVYEGMSRGESALPKLTKGQKINQIGFQKTEGKTTPPSHFNEAALLKAMENPVKYMTKKDGKEAQTLKETGGLGTVATRADIIDKLFANFFLEKRGNEIYLTGKARQLLSLVPEDLKKPELTADWEQKLSSIAKGKLKQQAFMGEIRGYTKELIAEIQGSEGKFRHDNLTNTPCPVCGKKMLSVTNKQGKLLVCQDRSCGHRIRLSRVTNARCPQCHKKMELVGTGEKQKFVCVCGHKESMEAFQNRRQKEGAGVSKKDVANYMKKQQKEAKEPVNNAFAEALAKLNL